MEKEYNMLLVKMITLFLLVSCTSLVHGISISSYKEEIQSTSAIERQNSAGNDKVKDACYENYPCQNGGTCEMESEKDYRCICTMGFMGKNCDIIKWCYYNKDICGATPCAYDENMESGFCFCQDNFYFDAKRKACVELDKCLLERLKGNCSADHETCDRMGNCICEENYVYNDARSACEPDFCGKKSNLRPCGENMKCYEGNGTFYCSCKEGFRQIGEKCIKVDYCAPGMSICQQLCRDGKCSCYAGFDLNEDGYTCDAKEPSGCNLECGVGTCIKEGGIEKCICPEISHIFRENTCIDRCKANALKKDECPEKIGCLSDEEYGYICNCSGKYGFEDDGVHCKAQRMCSEGGGDEVCSLKGGVCEDDLALDEGYKCKCNFGYKVNLKTGVCEHMCETAHCDKQQALCFISVTNQAECICPPLLVKDSSGRCSQLAKFSFIGDFSVPKRKYEMGTDTDRGRIKRDTTMDISFANLLKDFEDSMDKIFDGYMGTSILNCTDEDEYWECFLEIKLNKDPEGKIHILSTPSVCLPIPGDSHCLILPNFIMKKRTADDAQVFYRTHPCDKGVIGKLCGDETECEASVEGFKCKCRSGYFRRTTFVPAEDVQVDVCEDIDECFNPQICPNTTTCSNLPGRYTCDCKDGYRLEEGKSVKIDGCRAVCDPNPCVHGRCSVSGKNGLCCRCDEGFYGLLCVERITIESNKSTLLIGIVVFCAILIILLTGTLGYVCLKKRKV